MNQCYWCLRLKEDEIWWELQQSLAFQRQLSSTLKHFYQLNNFEVVGWELTRVFATRAVTINCHATLFLCINCHATLYQLSCNSSALEHIHMKNALYKCNSLSLNHYFSFDQRMRMKIHRPRIYLYTLMQTIIPCVNEGIKPRRQAKIKLILNIFIFWLFVICN
jgi:hypothetical protein